MVSLLMRIIVAAATVEYAASVFSFNSKYLENEDMMEIEISRPVNGTVTSKYIAVAFAIKAKMKDADGYYCTHDNLTAFVITRQNSSPSEFQNARPATLVSANFTNGELRCKFRRPVAVMRMISTGWPFPFDFGKMSFHVLLAHGEIRDGKMSYHGFMKAKILPYKIAVERPNPVTTATCNKDKLCQTDPQDCSLEDPNCIFFSLRQENNKMLVELSGGFGRGQQYVAIAFSQHHEMKDADLYYCDGQRLTSGVIRKRFQRPTALKDEFVNVTMAATINGVGQCRFSRDLCVSKTVSNGTSEKFDFVTRNYYMLYAHGNTTRDGKLEYHGTKGRALSKKPVSLANRTDVPYQCVTIQDEAVQAEPTKINLINLTRSSTTVTTTSQANSRRLNGNIIMLVILGKLVFW